MDNATGWIEGGGETGALIRSIDWSKTPLGPPVGWPGSLKIAVGILLHSRHPMFLFWGPELIQFYNDAYLPSFGRGKHPAAMGQAGRDCWQEIWPIIWPQIDDVMNHGKSSWNVDHLVPIFRNGRIEEVYWTYSYSPVIDDGGQVRGTMVVCTETTSRVIQHRRLEITRELVESTGAALDVVSLMRAAASTLAKASSDIPFGLVYAATGPASELRLVESVGLPVEQAAARFGDAWVADLPAAASRGEPPGVIALPAEDLPGGPWPEHPSSALVVPLREARAETPSGYIVFGVSPRLPFDAAYRDHLLELAGHIAGAHARIHAHRVRVSLLEELESANRAKDDFLAMLGHELRNPLSPIVTALQVMRLRTDMRGVREREIIERQVEHLVRLVDDLLDVSKITRGKIELERELVEVGDVVAKAVEIAGLLIEQRKHQLMVDIPPRGLLWKGDPVRLAQVVANLLTNAARYTPPEGRIRVAGHRDGDEIVIEVHDNGVGISDDMLPRIFELFVQGKRNVDRAEGGLGLGLTLAKTLVTLHGGTIAASSAGLGKGSRFTIRLPAPPLGTTLGAVEAPRKPGIATVNARRVLVVDDNVDAAESLGMLLEESGHTVTIANDPVAALKSVEELHPDVAILDIGLPIMDGYQLAERIRATVAGSRCRLVALSGYGQSQDFARSLSAGFVQHLVKPVDVDVLLRVLDGE